MAEMTRMSCGAVCRVKRPSTSVTVPMDVPWMSTEAPITDSPLETTWPETRCVLLWASAVGAAPRPRKSTATARNIFPREMNRPARPRPSQIWFGIIMLMVWLL